ncbi:hypothetical protein VTL71DRAFT_2716 [Oculimacula yallundae]|uniref:Uncharacterized protein n=1 Tax=Oculimacula yallundae TaxID=86028 RepID=A0ABR4C9U3_9HELO
MRLGRRYATFRVFAYHVPPLTSQLSLQPPTRQPSGYQQAIHNRYDHDHHHDHHDHRTRHYFAFFPIDFSDTSTIRRLRSAARPTTRTAACWAPEDLLRPAVGTEHRKLGPATSHHHQRTRITHRDDNTTIAAFANKTYNPAIQPPRRLNPRMNMTLRPR